MKKNDLICLNHILNSIQMMDEYTEGMEKGDFLFNNLVQDGTSRQIEIKAKLPKIYLRISGKNIIKFPRVILKV